MGNKFFYFTLELKKKNKQINVLYLNLYNISVYTTLSLKKMVCFEYGVFLS